ncbi:MAG: hypothetical protein FWG40_01125 [Peptococcaceae bacterium]|nr:hypothetical protein [Peptococcaceae bacterium]
MALRVSINDLSAALSKELKEYGLRATAGVKRAVDKSTKIFVDDTKRDAPVGRRGKFSRSPTSKTLNETKNGKTNVWYVRSPEGSLSHLLKNGHRTRSGGRTRAQDFITANFEQLERNLEIDIKEVLEDGY